MSERDALKARAEELKLDFAQNISTAKLTELVEAAEASSASGEQNNASAGDDGSNSFEEALAARAAEIPAVIPAATSVLRVQGPAQGFRRAGRGFGAKPVDIPLADLSDDELAALENEPRLLTQRIETVPE